MYKITLEVGRNVVEMFDTLCVPQVGDTVSLNDKRRFKVTGRVFTQSYKAPHRELEVLINTIEVKNE